MTVQNSLKIVMIARHPDFKSRVETLLLKFVIYKINQNANDLEQVRSDANLAWSTGDRLERFCRCILQDVNLLNAAAENMGGVEITDEQLSGAIEPNLHAYVGVL